MSFYWIFQKNKIYYLLNHASNLLTEFEQDSLRLITHKELKLEKLLARCAVKVLLSSFLKRHPSEINIDFPKQGKPKVQKECIYFNYSHSKGYFAFAIDQSHEVGIDLELIRPIAYAKKIVERYFSNHQKKVYHHVSQDQKIKYFFLVWTKIEAHIKCRGASLFDYHPNDIQRYALKTCTSIRNGFAFSICSRNPKANFLEKKQIKYFNCIDNV